MNEDDNNPAADINRWEDLDANTKRERVGNFFVDETGNPDLFDSKANPREYRDLADFFAVGYLDVTNTTELESGIRNVKEQVLSDPEILERVDQAKIDRIKVSFHAKDDPPQVRLLVFQYLSSLSLEDVMFNPFVKFQDDLHSEAGAAHTILCHTTAKPRNRPVGRPNRSDMAYRFAIEDLFSCVNFLEYAEINLVVAKRRNVPFQQAITGKLKSIEKLKDIKLKIRWDDPKNSCGLQAVDYFLWALNRNYSNKTKNATDRSLYLDMLSHLFYPR